MKGQELDAKSYGLPARTKLIRLKNGTIALIIDRKSRIIMADAKTISKKIEKIHQKEPSVQVSLLTNAPICSKSKLFLEQLNISVQQLLVAQN